jgi:hypothetical protein
MRDQTETQSDDRKESWFDLLWIADDVIADISDEQNGAPLSGLGDNTAS